MEEYFQKALSHCIDIGMKQPCILCAVSPNGSVLAMRFNEGHDPDPLTEPFENDTFTAPLNLMVIDRDGKAMRVVINRERTAWRVPTPACTDDAAMVSPSLAKSDRSGQVSTRGVTTALGCPPLSLTGPRRLP